VGTADNVMGLTSDLSRVARKLSLAGDQRLPLWCRWPSLCMLDFLLFVLSGDLWSRLCAVAPALGPEMPFIRRALCLVHGDPCACFILREALYFVYVVFLLFVVGWWVGATPPSAAAVGCLRRRLRRFAATCPASLSGSGAAMVSLGSCL